jgi:heme/copper-type cytochrome/quinol oxidase subunit 2
MVVTSLVTFGVSLIIGAIGIYVGASLVSDVENFSYALVTALVGGILWGIIEFFVPLIGGLVAFIVYLWLVNNRYPGGWIDAILITLVAWLAVIITLVILSAVGVEGLEAYGVPG